MKLGLTKGETNAIIAGLQKIGWTVEGKTIYAPHRTIWFQLDSFWTGSLRNFRIRMLSRLYDRILKHKPVSKTAAADTRGLVEVLEELCGDGGLQNYFKRLEPTLTAFAKDFNLRLLKFSSADEAWSFSFRHPLGGTGWITVSRKSEKRVLIRILWNISRGPIQQLHVARFGAVALNRRILLRELTNALQRVLNWTSKDLKTEFLEIGNLSLRLVKLQVGFERRYPVPRSIKIGAKK